jgi:hypothetical protein
MENGGILPFDVEDLQRHTHVASGKLECCNIHRAIQSQRRKFRPRQSQPAAASGNRLPTRQQLGFPWC